MRPLQLLLTVGFAVVVDWEGKVVLFLSWVRVIESKGYITKMEYVVINAKWELQSFSKVGEMWKLEKICGLDAKNWKRYCDSVERERDRLQNYGIVWFKNGRWFIFLA